MSSSNTSLQNPLLAMLIHIASEEDIFSWPNAMISLLTHRSIGINTSSRKREQ
jgi:hypothetical protein